jgi:uncharacterized protein (DUF2147 family)
MAVAKAVRRSSAIVAVMLLPAMTTVGAPTGPASAAVPQAPVEGVWLTDSQTELTITTCSQGFCGYISRIVVPDDVRKQYGDQIEQLSTADYVDINNKDPKLRNRPIQGLQILTLHVAGNPRHYEGEIYNPQDGNVYSGAVDVMGADTIKLKGCWLYVLCQEQQWSRVLPDPQTQGKLVGR